MYDLSPFDETIFLDADIIMFPKRPLDELFEEFRDIEFTIQNRGYIDLSEKDIKETSYWCDILEMKRLYGFRTGKYYHIHSEFVFFRKGAKIEKLFNSAKEIYNNLKCSVKTVFAGAIPDELPIAIAMRQNSVYPHKDNYRPIFWPVADKKSDYIDLHNLYDNFFGYSTGGSFHSKTMKANYNRLAKFHSNRAGINQVYFLTDKRKFLPERTNI